MHESPCRDVALTVTPRYARRLKRRARALEITGIGMTNFVKREEGFEKQFAHDEELKFKATARRNKLLGLWAAEKLGLTGPEAEAYARALVMADLEATGNHDMFGTIRKDF